MKLERFDKHRGIKDKAILLTGFFLIIISLIVFYNSFAYFEETKSFNILEGKVPTINKGDVKFAVMIDEVKDTSGVIPSKNSGYNYKDYECTNNAEIKWYPDEWAPLVLNLTQAGTVCTLKFEKIKIFAEYLMNSGELNQITHTVEPVQTGTNTKIDYRYQGKDVNNYVNFNGEKWRIIGVFNTDDGSGNYAWRVKLIRATGLEDTMVWDNNETGDWNKASLKNYLNDAYYNSLTSTAQNQINQAKWYLGGYNNYEITAEKFFEYEQGITIYSGRSLNWTGKVGLMYPSDYGYATNASCSTIILNTWNNNSTCYTNDWIYKGNFNNNDTTQTSNIVTNTWTISPYSKLADHLFYVASDGRINGYDATRIQVIRPTIFLDKNIKVTGGDGQINFAYDIELN